MLRGIDPPTGTDHEQRKQAVAACIRQLGEIIEADATLLLQGARQHAPAERMNWVHGQLAQAAVIDRVLRLLRLAEVTAESPATAPAMDPAPPADLP